MLVFGHSGYPVILFPTTMGKHNECKDNKQIHPSQRAENHEWYDQFILNEIVNPICKEKNLAKVAVAGPSFGGYQASNFAFKHPEKVSHMFSMSGAFDIRSFVDGHYDNNVFFNNPIDFLPGNNHSDLWKMKIILGVGEWDICLEANNQMAKILEDKNIPFWYDIRKWAKHDWPLWRDMFPEYLSKI